MLKELRCHHQLCCMRSTEARLAVLTQMQYRLPVCNAACSQSQAESQTCLHCFFGLQRLSACMYCLLGFCNLLCNGYIQLIVVQQQALLSLCTGQARNSIEHFLCSLQGFQHQLHHAAHAFLLLKQITFHCICSWTTCIIITQAIHRQT